MKLKQMIIQLYFNRFNLYIFYYYHIENNKETSQSNNEFLSNFSLSIDEQYEILNDKSWFIINNKNDNNQSKHLKSKKKENDHQEIICNDHNFSKMLAYNNNILDKMILAHAYQQQFGEVSTYSQM